MTRWRWLTVALCLWWFYRIDAASLVIVPDGGLTDARLCESLAAQYGYLVLPLESRDEYRPDGKRAFRVSRVVVDLVKLLIAIRAGGWGFGS